VQVCLGLFIYSVMRRKIDRSRTVLRSRGTLCLPAATERQCRARFHCSRSVFARRLFTNERTLEKWEQGRAKPNAQAVALLLLAARYPDTFERLEQLAR
jgi:putative transcriptional regulator